jgi:hypothetical protein
MLPIRKFAGTASVVALLGAIAAWAPATSSPHLRLASTTDPTNAAKVFRWGNSQWHDGFTEPLQDMWKVNHPALVDDRHGMLTLQGTSTSGTVSATLTKHARRYGRWEARVRVSHVGSTSALPYEVVWELIPVHHYHCGARSIVLADYPAKDNPDGTNEVNMFLRNTPNVQYSATTPIQNLSGQNGTGFHTYAIEVTKDHISWFVDTKVLRTETDPLARTGAWYKVRFRLVAPASTTMNPAWMQMDWVRYYTLDRPDAQSIDAPEATSGTYSGAC